MRDDTPPLSLNTGKGPSSTIPAWQLPGTRLFPALSFTSRLSQLVAEHIRTGRFQRSMALVTAGSSLISGLEVGYEHYKGSYSNPVMYSPVLLSAALTGSATVAVFNRRAAQTALRYISVITLIDGVIGFGFHIRGVHRKPGGWRLPVTNIIMGPPIFAPLLFGTAAYLGFIASYLRPENGADDAEQQSYSGWRRNVNEGRFQKQVAFVSALWAVFSGFEAWYSHYKSNFRFKVQWSPVLLTPVQVLACLAAIANARAATTLLPVTSAIAVADGTVGFCYHVRGVLRRSGGRRHWLYNILYGPPIFAPLLFAACGALGLLAGILRREGAR